MAALVHQRCFHHSNREAVARCLECRHFYCRECVTEHDDRLICSNCLARLSTRVAPRRLSWAWPVMQLSVGLFIAWLVFYLAGAALLSLPSQYHEGTVWIDRWWSGR